MVSSPAAQAAMNWWLALPPIGPLSASTIRKGMPERGQQHLGPADRVHLFADDLGGFLQRAPTERQEIVSAGLELADQARAEHQLVADDLGVGGVLFLGGDQRLGPAHRIPLQVLR